MRGFGLADDCLSASGRPAAPPVDLGSWRRPRSLAIEAGLDFITANAADAPAPSEQQKNFQIVPATPAEAHHA